MLLVLLLLAVLLLHLGWLGSYGGSWLVAHVLVWCLLLVLLLLALLLLHLVVVRLVRWVLAGCSWGVWFGACSWSCSRACAYFLGHCWHVLAPACPVGLAIGGGWAPTSGRGCLLMLLVWCFSCSWSGACSWSCSMLLSLVVSAPVLGPGWLLLLLVWCLLLVSV